MCMTLQRLFSIGLEYRIIDTHLVLTDIDADIVVDYMLDVMCQSC
jgi:hypothetical protein